MIFNTYFPAPTGSIFGPESFEKVRGSIVTLRMADKKVPAKVLDITVDKHGTGAHFTFEVVGELHYRAGPNLDDILTIELKE